MSRKLILCVVAALAPGGTAAAAAGAEGAGGDPASEVRLQGAVVDPVGERSTARWSPRCISRPGSGPRRTGRTRPPLKLELSPRSGQSLMIGYRAAWLASRRDALTTNGMQDRTGTSGSFIGHLLETSLRVRLLPGNLDLELGGAHLFAGELLTSQTPSLADVTYGYVQTTFTF